MTIKTVPADLTRYVMPLVGTPPDMGGSHSYFSAGAPTAIDMTDADTHTFSWEATFTPEQDAEWDDAVALAEGRARPLDFPAMKPHFATLKSYHQTASPTQAQTVTALKSVIFVLREMWRE